MSVNQMAAALPAPYAEHVDAAPDGALAATGLGRMKARTKRWISLLVAVSAMALMLAGTMAEPAAAARPNPGTVAERCADVGGDPTVYGVLGVNFTYCDFGDGTGVWGID